VTGKVRLPITIIIVVINVIYMVQIRIDAANAPCRLLQAL